MSLLNSLLSVINGGISLTANRAVISDSAGTALAASATTSTELGYVSGVTSSIQTQLNAKASSASPTFTGQSTFQGGQLVATRVVTSAGAATITSADYLVIINKTVGEATVVNLPAGFTNTVFIIKDGKGDALANNITITPAAGNIDGSSTYVLNTNYSSATIVYNGTEWSVI